MDLATGFIFIFKSVELELRKGSCTCEIALMKFSVLRAVFLFVSEA